MPTAGKSNVIPSMRYRDAPAAIDWLCRVLGFSKGLVVPGDGGIILHAQLTLGDGMIMLGSERDDAHGALMSVPGPGGANTQSAYVVVDDPEEVHERAAAAGAEIISPLDNPEYGGTFFACRRPRGPRLEHRLLRPLGRSHDVSAISRRCTGVENRTWPAPLGVHDSRPLRSSTRGVSSWSEWSGSSEGACNAELAGSGGKGAIQ